MSMRPLFFAILVAGLTACRASGPSGPSAEDAQSTGPSYILDGDIRHTGSHSLQAGDTVSSVVQKNFDQLAQKPATVLLIRHGPEGKTHELIQLDPAGHLMDPKQDYALRDGDELMFSPAASRMDQTMP